MTHTHSFWLPTLLHSVCIWINIFLITIHPHTQQISFPEPATKVIASDHHHTFGLFNSSPNAVPLFTCSPNVKLLISTDVPTCMLYAAYLFTTWFPPLSWFVSWSTPLYSPRFVVCQFSPSIYIYHIYIIYISYISYISYIYISYMYVYIYMAYVYIFTLYKHKYWNHPLHKG